MGRRTVARPGPADRCPRGRPGRRPSSARPPSCCRRGCLPNGTIGEASCQGGSACGSGLLRARSQFDQWLDRWLDQCPRRFSGRVRAPHSRAAEHDRTLFVGNDRPTSISPRLCRGWWRSAARSFVAASWRRRACHGPSSPRQSRGLTEAADIREARSCEATRPLGPADAHGPNQTRITPGSALRPRPSVRGPIYRVRGRPVNVPRPSTGTRSCARSRPSGPWCRTS